MPAFLLCGNSEDAIVKGFKHEAHEGYEENQNRLTCSFMVKNQET